MIKLEITIRDGALETGELKYTYSVANEHEAVIIKKFVKRLNKLNAACTVQIKIGASNDPR